MSELVQITDSYNTVFLPLVPSQFRNSTRLLSIIKALARQHDDLEVVFQEYLISLRLIPPPVQNSSGVWVPVPPDEVVGVPYTYATNCAAGEALDFVGSKFAISRIIAENDYNYRARIKQAAALRSFCTPEDIIATVKALYGATWVQFINEFPAACAILSNSTATQSDLERISPSGVQVRIATPIWGQDNSQLQGQDSSDLYGIS